MLNHISLLCIIYGLTILLPNNIVAKTLRAKTLQATKPALRAKQPTVFISMKSVIQQVIKNSMEYKKIIAEQNTTSMPLLQAEMPFDWRLKSTVKQDNLEHNSWGVSSGIQKQFITGTQLELKNDYLNSIKSSQTDVQNLFTLTIQQDLLQNWMGQKNQYQLEKANILSQRSQIQLTEQTEQLIIQSVQQFWKTCLNQLSLHLKKLKRKDYQDLAKLTRKKNQYQYLRPGELYQILAEWERAKQEVILQKLIYENEYTLLTNLLNIPKQNIKINCSNKKIPSPPLLKTPKTEVRSIEHIKKNLLIKQADQSLQQLDNWPTLQIFGSHSIGGKAMDSRSAWENLKSGQINNYSMGVKLEYLIPSTPVRRKRQWIHEQAVASAKWELEIAKREFEQQLQISKSKLRNLYQSIIRSKKINTLRAKSYREIRKAYLQGRLNVFELISARTASQQSEMENRSLIAQYYIVLTTAHALTDTLIEKYIK